MRRASRSDATSSANVVPEPHARACPPERVLERVGVVEIGIGHQAQRLGELGLRLAGEADDDVGGEGDARDRCLSRATTSR
jgi:hypothetical protein